METLLDKLLLIDDDTLELNELDVDVLVLPLEYVEYTVVVGVLTLADVDVDTLLETLVLSDEDTLVVVDVETPKLHEIGVDELLLALEYVEYTVVVGVLTLVEIEVEVEMLLDTLVLTDVDTLFDTLELNDVDVEVLVDFELDTLAEVLVLALEYVE